MMDRAPLRQSPIVPQRGLSVGANPMGLAHVRSPLDLPLHSRFCLDSASAARRKRAGAAELVAAVLLATGLLAVPLAAIPAHAAPVLLPQSEQPAPSAPNMPAPAAAPANPQPAPTPAPVPTAPAPQATPAPPSKPASDVRLRFNFKGQTYDQILDWFSRMTGYPIVREVPVPAGAVDYIYPGEYTLPQALQTLNILLQTQGVMLRMEGERLFLQKLDDMKRENVPTFVGSVPADITDDQIVTVVVPLLNARAMPVAEQLKNLVAAYGSVTPLEQQNALVLVETAAQVRRIQKIIAEIDQQDVENLVEFIPLRYAKAAQMLKSLTALMGERVVEYVINPADGKRSKLEENRVAGLVLAADDRTNAIVARGTKAKIDQVRETIALLDVPGDDNGAATGPRTAPRGVRTIRTITLERQTPAAAKAKLEQLYAALPVDRRPTIVAFEDTNRIALAGEPNPVAEGEQILRELEGDGAKVRDPKETRLMPLAFAKAADLQASLEAMAPTALAETGGAAPSIKVVDASNSLLVVASPRQHEIIATLVKALDVERGGAAPLRILQLRTADAATLAQTLTQNYAKRSPEERVSKPVSISADAATNTLLVAASPDVFPEIKSLVDELNGADQVQRASADAREIRIFPLKVAQASELAKTIDEMFPPPPAPVDARGRARPELAKPREVVVRADVQTNSLIVDGPSARMAGFQQLVEQLDRQQLAAETEVHTWRLTKARLEPAAIALRQLAAQGQLGVAQGRGQAVISTEPISGTLIVSGPKEIFVKVNEVLKGLGGSDLPPTMLKTYHLKVAKADTLAPMLRQVLSGRIRQDLPDAATELDRLLDVTPDKRSNALIVSAPESLIPLADELVKQLDEGTSSGEPTVRVRPLTFAEANAVAASLSQTLPTVTSSTTHEPMNVRVVAAGGANALLLVGPAADLDEVDKLIEPLDARPASDAVDAKSYALKFGQAATIAPVLERLLNDQQETDPRIILERIRRSRGQVDTTPKVRVEADARTNSIIVSGPQRTVALAETLLQQLDTADVNADRTFQTFTPANAAPDRLAETARKVLEATKPAGSRATIDIVVEPQSASLVVVGPKAEADRALEVLHRFDAAAVAPPQMDIAVIALKHSDPATIAGSVQPLLLDRSRWPQSLVNATKAGLSVAEPRVTADTGANRVLVSAPKELLPMAQELIARLDQAREASTTSDIKVFTLGNADAAEVARALTASADGRAKSRPGEPRPTITSEASSNAVVVAATPEQLQEFEEVVAKLDSGSRADAVQVRTVFLKNARAEQVAPMVEKLLAPAPQPPLPNGRPRPQAAPTEPPVRALADARLNAVIVSATSSTLNIAEQMVQQLDQAPGDSGTRGVRVLSVTNADANEIAKNLEDVFRDGGGAEVPPTVRVNASGNALIVRATDAQFATIEKVVAQLDRATIATTRQLRTLAIDPSKASAAEVAQLLERLLRDREGSAVEVVPVEDLLKKYGPKDTKVAPKSTSDVRSLRQALVALAFAMPTDDGAAKPDVPNDPDVTIAVDEKTNSLILLGSPKALDRVRQLAEQAQRELPAESTAVRAITLPDGMDLDRIRSLVSETLTRMTPAGGKPGDVAKRVALIADPASRALVVAASDRDFEIVGELVATFARNATPDRLTVKSYALTNVSADRAARGLRELLQAGANPRDPRFHDLSVTLDAGGKPIEATFDPTQVRAIPDAARNSIVVIAPGNATGFVDRFIELADQAPAGQTAALRLIPLQHAKAPELVNTLGGVFRARAQGIGGIAPDISADARTNTLVVNGSAEALREIESLVAKLDAATERDRRPLVILDLQAAEPQVAADLLQKTVVGDNQARRESTLILPDAASGTLLVRADDGTLAEIRTVLKEIDRSATTDFKVRSIVLERADAGNVAQAIQRFYDDRAKIATGGRQRRDNARRVSIVGDSRSATLLVSASDADFDEIKTLVTQFDSAKATQSLEFRVYQLEHARAEEIVGSVQSMLGTLFWTEMTRGFNRTGGREDRSMVAVRADPRMNALIVTGRGESFALIDQVVEQLDRPAKDGERLVVRAYPIRAGELDVVAGLVRDALGVRDPRPGDDGPRTRVVPVSATRTVVVSATERDQKQVAELLANIDQAVAGPAQTTQVIPVEFAQAGDLALTLKQFLADRRGATKGSPPTIMASGSANALIVSAAPDDIATIRDLLTKLDQPTSAGDRAVEILALERGQALEVARMISEQFGKRGGGAQGVIVTPDARTNSLVVNAPPAQLAQVKALVARLDGPSDASETVIRTYAIKGAKADEIAKILGQTLQLDNRGRTKGVAIKLDDSSTPVQVVATVVADRRSNALVVTATSESLPVIESLIAKLQEVPAASPVEYRVLPLKNVVASDVAATLRRLVRERPQQDGPNEAPPSIDANRLENQLIVGATADQFRTIEEILKAIDVPSSRPRTTDFVAMKFAEAQKVQDALSYFYGRWAAEADTPDKQNVRIVADTTTNSLVISAAESEWQGIRQLIAKLDSEDYKAGVQLRVLPLLHADAKSVASAINEAFRGPERVRRQSQPPKPEEDRGPTTLIRDEDWVSAAAEEGTNSIVVSANRQNLERIEAIVKQIDIADFDRLPAPRLIPVRFGNPEQLAQAIDRIYAPPTTASRDQQRSRLRIVADAASNALIVRAPDDEYQHILAIADALQQQANEQGLTVHLLKLKTASASRVAAAIREAFTTRATQTKLPLSVQIDAASNSLVIAATGPMFDDIKSIVDQMDAMSPGAGQTILVIDLAHVAPEDAKKVIEQIGLDKPQPDGATSKVVIDPVKVSVVPGRAAIIVVGNPADRETLVSLVKAIDSEPNIAESTVRVVALKNAKASALAKILTDMLQPGAAPAANGLAKALQEQVRRLAVRRDGANQPDLKLDLTKPVKVLADEGMNAVLLSSTLENVTALEEVVKSLDTLPVTDAVTVRIFPLENIAAQQFARIVKELFTQGKKLGDAPGGLVKGVPAGTSGRALMAEISMTTDDRSNTVIVAGPEDAMAFVEVLQQKLDTDVGIGWVEPTIVPLRWADADDLAKTLQSVLVDGSTKLPEATPMQKQIGRLRMAKMNENGGSVLEGDVFVPMSQLVVRPDSQLNALIVVGSRANVDIVRELVKQLDVEAASPAALVRVYPLQNASAARLATTVTQLFEAQRAAKTIRDEDRLRAIGDERTNSLIVSTSPRSFVVFEELLKTLDQKVAPEIKEIRTVTLTNASAARLAPMIQSLMDARLDRLRKVQPETADLERATVVADGRTNALVVAAGADTYSVIERLAQDLDRPETAESGLLQVVTVRKANVDRVASALNQIMERRYADLPNEVKKRVRPLVLTDPRTSSLLISAGPDDLKAIEELVAKLESTPANPAVGVEVIPVETARAEELAPRIQSLMRERLQSLGTQQQPSDAVGVTADATSNSLIVAASAENVAVVRNLVDVLSKAAQEAIGGQNFEVVQLAKSRAADIVAMLDEMYIKEENRRRGPNTVKAASEPRINAVLLSGSEPDIQTLRRMVTQLDGAKPNSVVEIKYLPLRSANVVETVNLIQTVLSGASIAGGGANAQQAIVMKYLRQLGGQTGDGPIEMEVSAAVRQSISLTPDVRTNTVIVRAPRESMQLIEQMVQDIDGSSAGAQSIRIFRLVNADADQMAENLRQLFNLQRRGNLYVLKPREEATGAQVDGGATAQGASATSGAQVPSAASGSIGLFGTELTLVPDERQQLAITVDSRTNSLLVSATPNYLELVEKVVKELDAQEANSRDTLVYRLKNAAAMEVARVLTDFVQKDQQKVLATLAADQRPSAQKLLEQEVTIVGDEKSNSVLVNASPRYMEKVKSVLGELDVDPPQVLIQVVLAEITLDAGEDLGFQFTRFVVGDTTVAGGFGLNRTGFATGQPKPPGLIGLAPALFGAATVPNIAIASEDFDLLINALKAQNRVELLSNPSVMVANNTQGRIQVGDTVRLPTAVSFNSAGQQSSVAPEEVGVILNVTPSINPEGFVRMKIEPEISRISKDTTQISENFQSPIINRRRANTTVTVKDGQTVVIGGLIQDRFERTDRKIPLLGDIPLIGLLFQNKSEAATKTELLIVLTPHVVTTPEQIKDLSDKAIDKATLPEDIIEQMRKGELEGVRGTIDKDGRLIDPIAPPPDKQRRPATRPVTPPPNQAPPAPTSP
ncbi:MAG: secretin N-terminal domain-containing protein [Phycisphaerales bacterium]